jgi:hypothetical protein
MVCRFSRQNDIEGSSIPENLLRDFYKRQNSGLAPEALPISTRFKPGIHWQMSGHVQKMTCDFRNIDLSLF